MSNPWHLRVWRRVKVAPGLTINLSKSGPSLSVGPRGSKITFGHGRVRHTVGLPGTGLYMTRQLTSTPTAAAPRLAAPASALTPAPAPTPVPASSETIEPPLEIHYGMPLVVAAAIGVITALSGEPTTVAIGAAVLAFAAGLIYEWLAAHHPLGAKILAQVVVGLVAVATVVAGIVLVLAAAGVGASTRTSRRR